MRGVPMSAKRKADRRPAVSVSMGIVAAAVIVLAGKEREAAGSATSTDAPEEVAGRELDRFVNHMRGATPEDE